MSRPIAYNASGPLSGSIRGGSVNYTVDSGNRDYTTFASKKWVPSADGVAPIVFVTDTYTQGIELNPSLAVPLFYSCNGTGSAAILYTANRIPGSPGNYSDANVALNDLINARGYFILESNDPFEGVDADSLALDLDAAKMSSYPQVGTNWRDLSGNGNTGALTNGPTWNSNGWIVFDSTDDYVDTTLATNTLFSSNDPFSISITLKPTETITSNSGLVCNQKYQAESSPGGFGLVTYNTNQVAINLTKNDGTGVISYEQLAGTALTINSWQNITYTYNPITGTVNGYKNGTLANSNTSATYKWTPEARTTWIARNTQGGWQDFFSSEISNVSIYRKTLSTSEIKQNYFGSSIVTDGLVFAVDANNIVSYPKSGTSWYGLTGSFSGSLVNGASFNPTNGGSIVFDGADDYVSTNLVQTFTNELTVETWYRGTKTTRNHLWNFYGNNLNCNFNDSGYSLWMYWEGNGGNRIWFTSPNFTDGNIHHLVFRHSGSINQIYFDGQLLTPDLTAGTQTFTGVGGSGYDIANSPVFGGNVYTNRVYNRALTADEILQNYQAEQYRFETPAGPVTNGLVLYLDAGNLDSYPGTGTTIYDLSGNGNNGTLYNGVGFNQTNGGVLTFDGVDDYVDVPSPNLASTNYTVMGAGRYVSIPYIGPPYGAGRLISANSTNWLLGLWGGSTENYYAEGWVSSVAAGTSNTSWRIWTGTGNISGDSYSVYVNNSLTAGPNTGGSAGPNGFSIGRYAPGGDEYSNSNLGFLLAYNRVLTVDEMTQNYNYFKGRFGL